MPVIETNWLRSHRTQFQMEETVKERINKTLGRRQIRVKKMKWKADMVEKIMKQKFLLKDQ